MKQTLNDDKILAILRGKESNDEPLTAQEAKELRRILKARPYLIRTAREGFCKGYRD